MTTLYVLVTIDNKNQITSLFSPDFSEWVDNLLAINDEKYKNIENYKEFISAILTDLSQIYNFREEPKKILELQKQPIIHKIQKWERFDISLRPQNRVFAKTLPLIGHFTTLTSTLCGCVITFMALRIASSDKDSDNSALSNTLSSLGTLLSALIGIVVYIHSPASETLTFVGRYFDRKCNRGNNIFEMNLPLKQAANKYKYNFSLALALACVTTNTFIAAVSMYQESILVVEKYLTLNNSSSERENEAKRDLYKILVYILVGTAAYRSLAFQGGFAFKLIEKLKNKPLAKEIDNSWQHEESEFRTALLYNFSTSINSLDDNVSHDATSNSPRVLAF